MTSMHDPRETRLVAVSVAASIALHAALLVWGPALRDFHSTEVLPPLQVVLVPPAAPAASPEPERAPAPRHLEPERKPPPVKHAAPPPPRPVPVPRAEPTPPTPAPIAPAPPAPPAEASAPAPAAPAALPSRTASEPAAAARGEVASAPPTLSPPNYKAAYLSNPPPAYPRVSRRNGEEGTVVLRVRVSAAGAAIQVQVERTSGSERLDAAALEAVKAWRFVPARRGAEAIEASVLVPIVFSLSGTS